MDTIKKRQEDATSKETLNDLEDETSLDTDDTDDSDGPSPDGAFDDEEDLKDADPI
ncbi:MAG: hypothetical protein LC794_18515 [Acidobacteria bacterium]|nr:hypothetical protein [Acidobacteriota bacterium]